MRRVVSRASGLDYTVNRVAVLLDRPARKYALVVGQDALPFAPRHRIAGAGVDGHATYDLGYKAFSRLELH